jgi:hypothetical protein
MPDATRVYVRMGMAAKRTETNKRFLGLASPQIWFIIFTA